MSRSLSKINLIIFLIAAGSILGIKGQNTPEKLNGRIIGTAECVDYSTGQQSYTVNTAANAFDGDLQNMFATYQRSGGWAGMDLGEKHIITQIAYCPRPEWGKRLVLGVFEGANHPDFGDAVPLFMISSRPEDNRMTAQSINCSRGFRYVRYVGPNDVRCNIAEIEFYGHPGQGDDSKLIQITNLPTISIHTTNADDIVEKEKYLKGIVSVISENGTQIYTDSLNIRGRGNASWNFPKKPYRMKLYEKASLLGLPAKEKNWTLINNYGDKTLMRNLLAFDLSRRLEMPYTPAGVAVDVLLNGEYKGTYQLCDQIEVADKRVEVEKMKKTDTSLPKLSGGYLIEIDAYASGETSKFYSKLKNIPVTIQYPKDDEIVSAQSSYIKSHFEAMESALFSSNFRDPNNGYRKYLDMETFIRHFLVGEISGNTDTYWSVYMYKQRNEDIFRFGPVWDFDLAYENDNRTFPINSNPAWIYNSKGSAATGARDLVNRIFSDILFQNQLRSVYSHYRDKGILSEEALLKVVDEYAEQMNQSQMLNFMRWDILNKMVHQNSQALGSYQAEVNNVKNYIRERIKWMDKKLNYQPDSNPDPNPDPGPTTSAEEKYGIDTFVWVDYNTVYLKGLTDPVKIEVFDTTGRLISSKHTSDHQFSVSLNRGLYLIRSTNSSGKHQTFKCIVP
ncbi:MAG: CotH kinase family protein [Bacteroidales bacterium]|jgi:hypothetical protein|nr:CotH kinase family protein [Bacteroidales bacterium]